MTCRRDEARVPLLDADLAARIRASNEGAGPCEASEVSDCGPPVAGVEVAKLAGVLFEADCSASCEQPVVVGAGQPEAIGGAQLGRQSRMVGQGAGEELDGLARRMLARGSRQRTSQRPVRRAQALHHRVACGEYPQRLAEIALPVSSMDEAGNAEAQLREVVAVGPHDPEDGVDPSKDATADRK